MNWLYKQFKKSDKEIINLTKAFGVDELEKAFHDMKMKTPKVLDRIVKKK